MENLNNPQNKKKIDIVIVSVLIAGLLLGGVVGGALYALVFDSGSGTTQQGATNVSSSSNSNEQAEAFEMKGTARIDAQTRGILGSTTLREQINQKRGLYSCDFHIGADREYQRYVIDKISYKEADVDSRGFDPVATLSMSVVNPHGLFGWYIERYDHENEEWNTERSIITYKNFSDWDGIEYSGSFGLRNFGEPYYPVLTVDISINHKILAEYNEWFAWNLNCTPVQNTEAGGRTSADEFVYEGVGSQFFQMPSLLQGHYECSIDVTNNKRREHEKYNQPYLIGGGGLTVESYTDYTDYSQSPTITRLIQTNPWDERKSFFGLEIKDQQPLIQVSPARAEDKAEWTLACNKISPDSKTSSLNRDGINVERFYSNLQPGTYSCTSDGIQGFVYYPDQDEPVAIETTEPGSVSPLESFELTVTETSVPYIEIANNYHGYGGPWNIECNQK